MSTTTMAAPPALAVHCGNGARLVITTSTQMTRAHADALRLRVLEQLRDQATPVIVLHGLDDLCVSVVQIGADLGSADSAGTTVATPSGVSADVSAKPLPAGSTGFDFTEGGTYSFAAWHDQPVGGTPDAPVRRMSDQHIMQTIVGYVDTRRLDALATWLAGPSGLDRAAVERAAAVCAVPEYIATVLDTLCSRHPGLMAGWAREAAA